MSSTSSRYTSVAITLHWVMAIAFLLMLASGFTMKYAGLEKSLTFSMYQWHKSLGVLLLVAVFLRVVWRLSHIPPALPVHFPPKEVLAAKLGHAALYLCMILLPVSGWVVVSSSVYGLPTIVFGLFQWPHVPGIAMNKPIHEVGEAIHFVGAIAFVILILGHIAAVVKHAFIDHENLVKRMWWSKGL